MSGNLKQIDAGSGSVVGVNDQNELFVLTDNDFKEISGSLKHFSVGPAGQLGVDSANNIFKYQSGFFIQIPGEELQRAKLRQKTSLTSQFTCFKIAKVPKTSSYYGSY